VSTASGHTRARCSAAREGTDAVSPVALPATNGSVIATARVSQAARRLRGTLIRAGDQRWRYRRPHPGTLPAGAFRGECRMAGRSSPARIQPGHNGRSPCGAIPAPFVPGVLALAACWLDTSPKTGLMCHGQAGRPSRGWCSGHLDCRPAPSDRRAGRCGSGAASACSGCLGRCV